MSDDNARHRVFKFGGSSLGSPAMLQGVFEILLRERAQGRLAVVVSAMGETTDMLIEAADLAAGGRIEEAEHVVDRISDQATATGLVVLGQVGQHGAEGAVPLEITPLIREHFQTLRTLLHGVSLLRERTQQTLDTVLSFGERLSARLLAGLLNAAGIPAVFVDAREWVVTDDNFGEALVDAETTNERVAALRDEWNGSIPVVTGFIGSTPDGRTTTLGRNGSDYTATLLARGLGAREVVIWTDVSGVMTADPGLVSDAYPLTGMTYMEALELASYGARMFHARTMIPLIESGIPMRIRSTAEPDAEGTRIDGLGASDETQPTSVTSLEGLALLGVEWRSMARQSQVAERVLKALARADIQVWMENQSAHGHSTAVVIPAADVERAREAVAHEFDREIAHGDIGPVLVRTPVTLLTLVAEAMGRTAGVAGRFFDSLGGVGINIHASVQGASSRSVAAVIDGADTPVAVRTVHSAFNLAHQEVNLLVLGKGTVGGELLAQIRQQRRELEEDHDIRLKVAGFSDRSRSLFDADGIEVDELATRLAASEPVDGESRLDALLERVARLPVPVLVDCTAADGMEQVYEAALAQGIHVVAANKKPLTIAWPRWKELMTRARRSHRGYHYETTVGASLPVIDTIKNLVRTGDRVRLVEGAFSGTLGYLSNEIMDGVPISQAVRTAQELGYTEPRPQDDLSGLDVARKALILARELGYRVELDDVEVKPLVPAALMAEDDVESFLAGLEGYDEELAKIVEGMKQEGRVLRYLATVDTRGDAGCEVRVGPTFVDAAHPATRLRGAEAFVAFTTDRHLEYPLIVQGSGAGGAVTAAGVLADVLRTAQSLRGR